MPAESSTSLRRLEVVLTVAFMVMVGGLSVGLVLGELRDQFEISGFVAAAHVSAFGFALMTMAICGLPMLARFGRQRLLWMSATAVLAGVALLCAGRTWPVTLAGAVLGSLGSASTIQLLPGITADGFGDDRSAVFARVNAWPGLMGIAFALAVGLTVLNDGNWRVPYLVITAIPVVALVIVARGVRLPPAAPIETHLWAELKRPDMRGPALGVTLAVLCDFPPAAMSVLFLKEAAGASDGMAPILGAAWGLCILLSRLSVTSIKQVLGPWTAPAVYGLEVAGIALMWIGPSLTARFVGTLLTALAGGATFPLAMDRLYDEVPGDATAVGTVGTFAGGAAITVGTLSLGALIDVFSVRHSILLIGALAALGVVTRWPRRSTIGDGVPAEMPAEMPVEMPGAREYSS